MSTPALRFMHAHATHPQATLALELVWAQLASQGASTMGATLGWCYLTDHLAHGAEEVLASLRQRLPHVAWVGGVGVGVLAQGAEYIDEPALAVMLSNLPRADFRVFHGRRPLHALNTAQPGQDWAPYTAQVHADSQTPDLSDLIGELAERTQTGYLFGGLSNGRSRSLHLALDPTDHDIDSRPERAAAAGLAPAGVWLGGLSGVAFSRQIKTVSRVTQGCQPVGPTREVTASERNVIYELDGQPALSCLLADLNLTTEVATAGWQREALPKVRATLVGLTDSGSDLLAHGPNFGADTRVRHLIGLDPSRQGVAISDLVKPGMQLAYCQRHADAARRDLIRICAEIREEFDPTDQPGSRIAGGVYISCAGRGGPHFGSPNAEMEIVAHALGGDIPLVGFFAGGEIARHHLYGYTGVLTVWGE